MIEEYEFYKELFNGLVVNIAPPYLIIDMDREPWDIDELMHEVSPIIKEKIPSFKYRVNGYKVYEEEYGGFMAYGVLEIEVQNLSKEDIVFIADTIL